MTARTFSIPKSLLGRIPRHRSLSTVLNTSAALVGMTSLMLLVQISGVASMAYEVQRLEDLRTYWQETNYRAEVEIARLQSLNRVEEEATNRLQMVLAKNAIPVQISRPLQGRTLAQETGQEAPEKTALNKSRAWYQDILDVAEQFGVRR